MVNRLPSAVLLKIATVKLSHADMLCWTKGGDRCWSLWEKLVYLYKCHILAVYRPLGLEGAKLTLCKVAVQLQGYGMCNSKEWHLRHMMLGSTWKAIEEVTWRIASTSETVPCMIPRMAWSSDLGRLSTSLCFTRLRWCLIDGGENGLSRCQVHAGKPCRAVYLWN